MALSKAFDTVKHSVLFTKLLKQGLPFIIVHFVLITHRYQMANAKWNHDFPDFLNIQNGVKQGAVLSVIFYCLQKMLVICEKYASTHHLRFSTDPNPEKSKSKCMVLLLKKRKLANLRFCDNQLPCIGVGKHLGMKLENKPGSIVT